MDKIKYFFECLIPSSICNIKCEYCYIIQEERRNQKKATYQFSPEEIGRALTKRRLGGTCYFSICAAGETLVDEEVIDIVFEILKQGHYVNITTNGTLSNRIDDLIAKCGDLIEHLHISFSFHYIELEKRKLIDVFFSNCKKIQNAGGSIIIQLNLYDGYLPYLDEIKKLCKDNVGAMPQVAVTRYEKDKDVKSNNTFVFSNLSFKEYKEIGSSFDSKLFDFTVKNFGRKHKEYCYAGLWSSCLNLSTGELTPCYAQPITQNIFEEPDKKINFIPVGHHCKLSYCVNSSHFLSLGVIPEYECESYCEIRNREDANWFNNSCKSFLSSKLYETNDTINVMQKMYYEIKFQYFRLVWLGKRVLRKLKKICLNGSSTR